MRGDSVLGKTSRLPPDDGTDITAAQIPEVELKGNMNIKIICGEIGGVKGPANDLIPDPAYLDVAIPAGTAFSHEIKKGHTRS